MTELLDRHKRHLGDQRYQLDRNATYNETVPSMNSDSVRAFAAELSSLPAVSVPLRKDDDGLYGWPADGIREKIRTHGGSIRFGWRLREWPNIVLTAEFHAVWIDEDGALVDITPAITRETTSLFVPDPGVPETLDWDQRPATRYRALRVEPDRFSEVTERIARLKPTQRAYEEKRASKAGTTLEQWVLGKFPSDPMVPAIAAYVAACTAYETELGGLPDLIRADPRTLEDAILLTRAAITDGTPETSEDQGVTDADGSSQTIDATQDATLHGEVITPGQLAAAADSGADDFAEDELEDDWLPEYETAIAEDEMYVWSRARSARRNDILHMMPRA